MSIRKMVNAVDERKVGFKLVRCYCSMNGYSRTTLKQLQDKGVSQDEAALLDAARREGNDWTDVQYSPVQHRRPFSFSFLAYYACMQV